MVVFQNNFCYLQVCGSDLLSIYLVHISPQTLGGYVCSFRVSIHRFEFLVLFSQNYFLITLQKLSRVLNRYRLATLLVFLFFFFWEKIVTFPSCTFLNNDFSWLSISNFFIMSLVSLIIFFGGSDSYISKNQNNTDLKKCIIGSSAEKYSTSKKRLLYAHFDIAVKLRSLN